MKGRIRGEREGRGSMQRELAKYTIRPTQLSQMMLNQDSKDFNIRNLFLTANLIMKALQAPQDN